MSFILDALKRAEAEREQGRVPGLMAQHGDPLSHPAPRDPEAPGSGLLWRATLLALGLLIAGLLLWLVLKPEAAPLPALAPAWPDTARAPAPVMPTVPSPAAPPEATARPGPGIAPAPAPAPAPQATGLAPTPPDPALAEAKALKAAARAAAAASAAEAKARRAAERAASAASATDNHTAPIEKLPSLADLPPELRAGVPALAVGGAIHSKNRADRILIVNGVLLHEGESVAPGLVLEQIRLKSAVLRIRNQRFELAY